MKWYNIISRDFTLTFTDFNGIVSRVLNLTNTNLDALRVERGTWGEQFIEAMNVNGGNLKQATGFDYVMHFLTFGWKVKIIFEYHLFKVCFCRRK